MDLGPTDPLFADLDNMEFDDYVSKKFDKDLSPLEITTGKGNSQYRVKGNYIGLLRLKVSTSNPSTMQTHGKGNKI